MSQLVKQNKKNVKTKKNKKKLNYLFFRQLIVLVKINFLENIIHRRSLIDTNQFYAEL